MIEGIETTDLIDRLKTWVPARYHDLNDWEIIIKRAELLEDKIWAFKCSFQTVYLDKDTFKPVEYGKQHIIDNALYYDYNGDSDGAGTYNFINYLTKKGFKDLMDEEAE